MNTIDLWKHYYRFCRELYPAMPKWQAALKARRLVFSWDEREKIESDAVRYFTNKFNSEVLKCSKS